MIHKIYNTSLKEDKPSNIRIRAFTLIELLIVISIIATLAAILFPVFSQAKQAAKKTTCLSNHKQLAIAFIMYASDYDDRLAPANSIDRLSATLYVNNNTVYGYKYDTTTMPPKVTFIAGLLDPYLKSFQLTGCPAAADLMSAVFLEVGYPGAIIVNGSSIVGLASIGYNNGLENQTMSDMQEPANTVNFGDCGSYGTVADGMPADGIYPNYYLGNYFGTIHGRHLGKHVSAWCDGHAKTMPITQRDIEDPYLTSIGISKALVNRLNIGWLMPSGMVASGSPATIFNDPRSNNYFALKKK